MRPISVCAAALEGSSETKACKEVFFCVFDEGFARELVVDGVEDGVGVGIGVVCVVASVVVGEEAPTVFGVVAILLRS